jgi:G3E family GTPase
MTGETLWKEGEDSLPEIFSQFSFMNSDGVAANNSLNRNLLGIETKPPLYIVSGFLGSGKTSFIKNFLEFQSQKYLFGAVIQNELGETGLDGTLISDECRVVEMDEGCVCCSLSGNLRKGINSVVSEFVPDFIILETTGAANPMNLVSEINDLRDIVKFDSVTTVVDAININDTLKSYDIAKDQLRAADIIILNKTENMSNDTLSAIEKNIESLNKRAIITRAEFGRVNPALLYDSDIESGKDSFIQSGFFPVNNKTHSDDRINNHTIKFSDIPDRKKFLDKMENLPFDIFRIKGVLKFEEEEKSSLFQYVSGRYEISQHAAESTDSFLVFIGKELDTEILEAHFLN